MAVSREAIEPAAQMLRTAEDLMRAGNLRAARAALESLADVAPSGVAFFRLAQISHSERRPEDASRWLEKAVEVDSDNAEYQYTRGRFLATAGEDDAAESSLRTALTLQPDYVDARVSLGNLLRKRGRFEEAVESHRAALVLDPRSFLAHVGLGNALLDLGDLPQAADRLRQAVELNEESAAAHNSLGKALEKSGDWTGAGTHYLRAIELDPSYPQAAEGLGKALVQNGHYEEAIGALQAASHKRPEAFECRFVLGIAYVGARRLAAAIDTFERLLRDHPRYIPAKGGLAHALSLLGQYNKPRALFAEAVRESDDAWISWWYSHLLLRNGDFAEGWRHYGVRESLDEMEAMQRESPAPLWRGESLAGKSLLVTCEQGLGDEIMFSSVYPELIAEARHCILECEVRLVPLFQRSFPAATVVGIHRKGKQLLKGYRLWFMHAEENGVAPVQFDYWVPAGSVPKYRRTTRASFPQHQGYLSADPVRVEQLRARLDALGPGLKIGLSWRGGVVRIDTVGRSLTMQQLQPLVQTRGVHFVCLQYDDCAAELDELERASGVRVHHWPETVEDYEDTAALVTALDLTISVTTAAVHLAGALGRPAWAMVPFMPEWRYGNEGTSMIWYPSVRLFRQQKHGALDPAVTDVHRALRRLVAERGA